MTELRCRQLGHTLCGVLLHLSLVGLFLLAWHVIDHPPPGPTREVPAIRKPINNNHLFRPHMPPGGRRFHRREITRG